MPMSFVTTPHALTATTTLRFRLPANTTDLKRANTMDSAMHIPRVPHDLLRPIFENLESDAASLSAISLVSPTFREEAQRILFREVIYLRMHTAHIKFLRTVAASPTCLALFVRSYRPFWVSRGNDVEIFGKVLPNVVKDGLKAMRCLKELDIILPSPSYSPRVRTMYIQILSACTFSLERFAWHESHMNADELVMGFLPHQSMLRHLGLLTGSLTAPLRLVPSTTCPQLVSLKANWPIIKAFLPGRKISILSLTSMGSDVTKAGFKRLAGELQFIKALSIPFDLLRKPEALDHPILQYSTSLNVLEICDIEPYVLDLDGDECYPPIEVPHLLSMLSHLPELHTLILSGSPQNRDRQEDLQLSRNAFSKFGQHLKYMDFEICGDLYERHTSSQEIIQEIDEEEVRELWLPEI